MAGSRKAKKILQRGGFYGKCQWTRNTSRRESSGFGAPRYGFCTDIMVIVVPIDIFIFVFI